MILHGNNLIGFTKSKLSGKTFQAYNPADGEVLPDCFYIGNDHETELACMLANEAAKALSDIHPKTMAGFLDHIALGLESLGSDLISLCSRETGLPEPRLTGELGRTVNQIKMFSKLIDEGSWVEAVIDHSDPNRQPTPKPDIRKMLHPIGPVVVFGASNFPLAFSVAGGDTISALAAGNPVIFKAHPAHPGTSELVAEAIISSVKKFNLPEGTFSMLHDQGFGVGQALVQHPTIKAVAFTGSYHGGKALFDLAVARHEPIPVFAEMGSINPMFLLPNEIKRKGDSWGRSIAQSITLGAGQFCTNPGLIVLNKSADSEVFIHTLAKSIAEWVPQTMLTSGISERHLSVRNHLISEYSLTKLSESAPGKGSNQKSALVATVKAESFIQNPGLAEEVFGPFSLIVECQSFDEMISVAKSMKGQLTTTLIAGADDDSEAHELLGILKTKAGRIIFNGVPTGVEVLHAMQHGGPFPASTDSRFSSVGTSAIRRFVRPVAYQDCPDALLPLYLQEDNPLNIHRLVDGHYDGKNS